ncbi:hypothetical protein A2Y83_01145 [Candidatus Falkowbacteria bacterium RBG_13_39_14]|uniref:RecJ OB domain-containing protein n=1 Tax=Candidatus Falkowbacteria bacterium RBG_13_39_14 TaxID=1797985 RepID=A0A1F5S1N4_9BACT|nr:MAG: hypothetical protein A2Y83_01145 [Candidatus Falkowbacteria bacterium RBG_13_39_14]
MENPPLFQRGVRGEEIRAEAVDNEKGMRAEKSPRLPYGQPTPFNKGGNPPPACAGRPIPRPAVNRAGSLEKGVDQPLSPAPLQSSAEGRPHLEKGVKLLKRYGGHAQACGLSLSSEDDFFNFKKKFLEIAEMKLKGEDLFPKIKIDFEMDISDISWELIDDIKNMEPFGEGNPKPLIKLSNLEILDIRIMGNGGKHLKMKLTPPLSQRGAGGDFSTAGTGVRENEGTRDGAGGSTVIRAEAVEIEQGLRAEKSPRFADANRPPLEKGVDQPPACAGRPIPRFADANRPSLEKGVDQPPIRLSKKSLDVILNDPERAKRVEWGVKDPIVKRNKRWDSSPSCRRAQNDIFFRQPAIPCLPCGQPTPFGKGGKPSVINAVGFSMNDEERLWGEKLKRGYIIDIAGYIDVNEWNGNKEIQIKLCDLILVKKNDK